MLITKKDAMKILNVSATKLYQLVKKGKLETYSPDFPVNSNKICFKKSDLEKFLLRR